MLQIVQVRCKQFLVNASFEIRQEKLITVKTVTSTCFHDMTGFTTVCDSDPCLAETSETLSPTAN